MTDQAKPTGQTILGSLTGLTIAIAFGAIAVGIVRIAQVLEQQEDPVTVADYAAGAVTEFLIEEGFAASRLDRNEPLLELRTIVIAEAINERTARHVVERLLYLNQLDSAAPIDLFITTNGGWKDSAFAIIDTMERIEAPVNTIAIGGCYSAGTMLLVAGTGERTATRHSLLSIHAYPDLEDLPPFDLDPLDQERFRELYLRRSNTPADLFDVDEESQPYFDAEQALEWGLIDRIVEPRQLRPLRPGRDEKRAAELREARRPSLSADRRRGRHAAGALRVGV